MINKQLVTIALAVIFTGYATHANAQSKKEKKSRYYQNSEPEPEFNVKGFFTEKDKNEVDKKPVEDEYDVNVTRNEKDAKYKDEKRVIRKDEGEEEEPAQPAREKRVAKPKEGYYTTYGGYRPYNENREKYDKFYDGARPAAQPQTYTESAPPPVVKRVKARKETEIKMTENEHEYKTTVVKRRYTNLDVLCDDLDLAKIQRPVFKGICSECSNDVDVIILNKNLSSLEKNYQLKTCYMMRDKRLRETLDDDQYRKFLRIKDADEYLILTKDSELKDGVNH